MMRDGDARHRFGTGFWPLLLPMTVGATGCGAMLQTAIGFDDEQTRVAVRTRTVRLVGTSTDTAVERRTPDGWTRLADPSRDVVQYTVLERVAVPRSRAPLVLGTALDLALGGAALGIAQAFDGDRRLLLRYTAGYFGGAALGDAVFAAIYSGDDEVRVLSFEPEDRPSEVYRATRGDHLSTATVAIVWEDEARFDLPAVTPTPGGPRWVAESAPSPEPVPVVERWYGWQLIPLDVLAFGGFIVGWKTGHKGLMIGGASLYGAGPPIVHLAHGEALHALQSFGARALAPVAGGAISGFVGIFAAGASVECDGFLEFWCSERDEVVAEWALVGALVASAVAPFFDDGVLAWSTAPAEADTTTVQPVMGVTPSGEPTFGIGGRF